MHPQRIGCPNCCEAYGLHVPSIHFPFLCSRLVFQLDGTAGRWLAHELACTCYRLKRLRFFGGSQVHIRPQVCVWHLENRDIGRLHQCGVPAWYRRHDGVQLRRTNFHSAAPPLPDAIIIAVIGLVVNIACALILSGAHHHSEHGHHHGHHDLNLRSAYVHVIADATTSFLAIAALVGDGFMDGIGWTRLGALSVPYW